MLKMIKNIYMHCLQYSSYATYTEVERAEQMFYLKYLREGMTVFDVGANIGELSLLFSRCVRSTGQVHSFEASNETFNKLSRICQLAGRSQIKLNHVAVSDKEETVNLYVYEESYSGLNTLAERSLHEYGIAIAPTHIEEVQSITIDSYCAYNDIKQIDLLKVDVEGAEYQVLLGAHKMLQSKSIKCCVFEFGATTFDMGNSPLELEAYLNSLGYKVRNIVKRNPTFPGGSNAHFSIHMAMP